MSRLLAIASILFYLRTTYLASSGQSSPAIQMMGGHPGYDTLAHFAVMVMIGFFVNLGFSEARPFGRPLGMLKVSLLLAAGSAIEEMLQVYAPRRSVELSDLVASLLGISLGAGLVVLWRRLVPAASAAGPRADAG